MRQLAVFMAFAVLSWAGDFRMGRAAIKITPPVGGSNRAQGVHDDIYVKAVVLEQDGSKAAMITCDVSSVDRRIVVAAREAIQKAAGIPAERVMIAGTHTHTAFASGIGNVNRVETPAAKDYVASFLASVAQAVKQAQDDLKPVKVSAGVTQEPALVFNRRFLMKDGSTRFNPGFLNPNIVRPQGPVDPDVSVVYFEAPEAKPLATIVNYALHLDTTSGNQVSADYPYTLARVLSFVKGADMLTVFNIGTAGNINHYDVKRRGPQKGYAHAAAIGAILAGAVLKTYRTLEPITTAAPQIASEMVKLPLIEVKPAEEEKARAIMSRAQPTLIERVWARRVIDTVEAIRTGKPIEGEVQVITIGPDLAWVGLPGEIFVELGMAIKKASPYRFTIVNSLANGALHYVPNRKGFAEGSYEAINTSGGPGTGELLVDAATRLLISLHGN
jgi:hypothetical protein